MSDLIPSSRSERETSIIEGSAEQFEQLVGFITDNLAPASGRFYRHTYEQWRRFVRRNQLDVFDLSLENLADFLNRGEVGRLLELWARDRRPLGVRNYALLSLMIYTGLQRAEVVALRWDDIDFEDQLVSVRRGKGGKERIAAIVNITDETIGALYALWEVQESAYDNVFPSMTAGYYPRFCVDEAIHSETIVRVVGGSGKRIGIEHLSVHDLRRTHITLALNNGARLHDMQAQAGHAKSRRQRTVF